MFKNKTNCPFFSNKAQSSLEFLIIFGIGFTIIVVLGGIFFTYSTDARDELDQKQLRKTGDEIISNVEKIYFLGNNNMITLTSKFPDGIENFTIIHKNTSDGVTTKEFDYLNISYISGGEVVSNIFAANENYIRFNCSLCYHSPNINGNYTSHYNSSDFSGGVKKIKIISKNEYVQIDFVNE